MRSTGLGKSICPINKNASSVMACKVSSHVPSSAWSIWNKWSQAPPKYVLLGTASGFSGVMTIPDGERSDSFVSRSALKTKKSAFAVSSMAKECLTDLPADRGPPRIICWASMSAGTEGNGSVTLKEEASVLFKNGSTLEKKREPIRMLSWSRLWSVNKCLPYGRTLLHTFTSPSFSPYEDR